jgi:desulfoferrodoxin-like iron-binding protein
MLKHHGTLPNDNARAETMWKGGGLCSSYQESERVVCPAAKYCEEPLSAMKRNRDSYTCISCVGGENQLTKKGEINLCEICGNKVQALEEGGGTLVCCGQDMTLVR